MADTKISALTAATTPLAGTEVLPIVQSGVTKQVSVANLTAGRAVSALSFTSTVATGTAPFTVTSTTQVANLNAATAGTASNLLSNATTGVMQIVGPGAGTTRVMTIPNANFTAARTDAAQTFSGSQTFETASDNQVNINATGSGAYSTINFQQGGVNKANIFHANASGIIYILTSGGVQLDQNLIQGTAAKGINFTANTGAAGKTSQLLNWYEEGTWTPSQGAGVTVTGAFSSSGTYTRIGRQVTVRGQMSGATNITVANGDFLTTNLPFASSASFMGVVGTGAATVVATCISSSTSLFASAVATTASTVYFTITYFV